MQEAISYCKWTGLNNVRLPYMLHDSYIVPRLWEWRNNIASGSNYMDTCAVFKTMQYFSFHIASPWNISILCLVNHIRVREHKHVYSITKSYTLHVDV